MIQRIMPVAEQLPIWKIELARLCQPYTNSKVCFDIPLSKQTYFGIGGCASAYLEVGEIDLLVAVARFKNDYRLDTFILGAYKKPMNLKPRLCLLLLLNLSLMLLISKRVVLVVQI